MTLWSILDTLVSTHIIKLVVLLMFYISLDIDCCFGSNYLDSHVHYNGLCEREFDIVTNSYDIVEWVKWEGNIARWR